MMWQTWVVRILFGASLVGLALHVSPALRHRMRKGVARVAKYAGVKAIARRYRAPTPETAPRPACGGCTACASTAPFETVPRLPRFDQPTKRLRVLPVKASETRHFSSQTGSDSDCSAKTI